MKGNKIDNDDVAATSGNDQEEKKLELCDAVQAEYFLENHDNEG